MNCKETDNSIRLYSQNGAIDTANTNAVSFVNGGTSIANLNGFPINPGQCISFGNEKDQCDKTKYQVAFINTGLQTNALYVFRGNSGIQFSQIIAAIGGTHDNVNIFDSAGSTLTASGGKLTVLDAAVVSAINALATSGLATSAKQDLQTADLNIMSGANGCYMLNVGTAWTGNAKALVVNADCFFSTIKQNGVSVITSKGFDGGVKAGGFLTPDATKTFTDLTLISGQVLIYF